MGRSAFRKSQKSVQNYANQHGTLCASNHLFGLMFGVFMALKLGIILWTLHLCSHCFRLFWMILLKNAMGRKFHHNYSNYSQSEATNQRYRCNPLWRAQLGSGKVSSSSSRTSRTSSSSFSSSSSDKTRQDNSRTHFRRYSGDTRRYSGDTPAIP